MRSYSTEVQNQQPRDEALIRLATDKDTRALLDDQAAAASFEAAEATMFGLHAAQLEKGLQPNLADALKAGGATSTLAADIDKKIEDYRAAAFGELRDHAVKDLDDAWSLIQNNSGTDSAPKWLTLDLKAAVYQNYSLVAPGDQQADALQQAQKAMHDALDLNPSLTFPGLAAAGTPAAPPASP